MSAILLFSGSPRNASLLLFKHVAVRVVFARSKSMNRQRLYFVAIDVTPSQSAPGGLSRKCRHRST